MAVITAQNIYQAETDALQKYLETNTDFDLEIEETFPFTVKYESCRQISLLDAATGEAEEESITVSVGLKTTVQNQMKGKLDAKILKTLIRKAEHLGMLYYIQFRETFER